MKMKSISSSYRSGTMVIAIISIIFPLITVGKLFESIFNPTAADSSIQDLIIFDYNISSFYMSLQAFQLVQLVLSLVFIGSSASLILGVILRDKFCCVPWLALSGFFLAWNFIFILLKAFFGDFFIADFIKTILIWVLEVHLVALVKGYTDEFKKNPPEQPPTVQLADNPPADVISAMFEDLPTAGSIYPSIPNGIPNKLESFQQL